MLLALDEADARGWRIEGGDARAVAREVHLQVEIYRRARAYRDAWLCDPRFADEKHTRRLKRWVDREHAAESLERIDLHKITPVAASPPAGDIRDTTYLCVADAAGKIAKWIQSIFHPFAAGFVAPGTGIILNNRMTGFSLDPDLQTFWCPGSGRSTR